MAYYNIIIRLKDGKEKVGIRKYEEPYPLVQKHVQEGAEKAWKDNIKEIVISKLSSDHPAVLRFKKRNKE